MALLFRWTAALTVTFLGFARPVGAQTTPSDPVVSLQAALPENKLAPLSSSLRRLGQTAPSVVSRRLEAEQSKAAAELSRSMMLPNASANANVAQIFEQHLENSSADRTIFALLYGVSGNQPIFHWGALSNAYRASVLQTAIAQRNVEETHRLALLEVRRQYLSLIISSRALANGRRLQELLGKEQAALKKDFEQGLISSGASTALDSRLIDLAVTLSRMENDLAALKRSLRTLVGDEAFLAAPLPEEVPPVPDLTKAIEALSPSSDFIPARLANARDALQAEELNLKVVSTRLLPKFNANVSVNQDNRSPDNDQLGPRQLLRTWTAGIGFSWSIFDGFATRAARRSSKTRIRSLTYERDQLERTISDERIADLDRLRIAWRTLRRAEETFAGSTSAIETAKKDLEAGIGTRKAVEDAEAAVDPAVQAVSTARADCYLALVTFLSNRGLDPALRDGLATR